MAQYSVVSVDRLDSGLILAPERYDPRRQNLSTSSTHLGDVVSIVSTQIDSKKADPEARFVILDTGDAQEGLIRIRSAPVSWDQIGSSKKVIRTGDVIISRLRPYLRQVALVDGQLANEVFGEVTLLCSTEFFVLRSRDSASIAFLVPHLLRTSVQTVLAASQEGGHHPRFSQPALEALAIPESVLAARERLSRRTEMAIESSRNGDLRLRALVAALDTD
jgi:hypothetical protein